MCPRHVGPPRPTRRHFGDLKRHPLLMRRFQPLLPRHFGGRSRRRHFAKCAGKWNPWAVPGPAPHQFGGRGQHRPHFENELAKLNAWPASRPAPHQFSGRGKRPMFDNAAAPAMVVLDASLAVENDDYTADNAAVPP